MALDVTQLSMIMLITFLSYGRKPDMSEHNLYYIRVILFSNTSLVYLIKQEKSIVLHWISLNSLTNLLFMTYVGYCTLRKKINKPWSYPLHAHKTLILLYHLVLFLCLPACYHVHAPLLLDTPWMSLCSFVFNTMLNDGVIIWIFFWVTIIHLVYFYLSLLIEDINQILPFVPMLTILYMPYMDPCF